MVLYLFILNILKGSFLFVYRNTHVYLRKKYFGSSVDTDSCLCHDLTTYTGFDWRISLIPFRQWDGF